MRPEVSDVIRYTSNRTVSYAKELTSLYICYYSQGNGLNTPLSIFYILYAQVSTVLCSVVGLLVFVPVINNIMCVHYLHFLG